MFSFDGSYRRTPVQSLGGASRSSDRDTLIRKAQEERQKRAEIRRQNNGATLIQSYARSFIMRQRVKAEQRRQFDALLATRGALNDSTLELTLRRILFFYYGRSRDDGERLIQLSQFIIRAPSFLLQRSVADRLWRLRLQRLLHLCTHQICQQASTGLSQTIPFRMLETFTSAEQVERHVPDARVVRQFLDDIYAYLVRRDYFRLLRQMLDEKVPPLDGPVVVPPNAISDTLLQMLMQPLRLVGEAAAGAATGAGQNNNDCCRLILASFVEHLLVPAYTDAVRSFVLPCLAASMQFPFVPLLGYLDEALAQQAQQQQQLQQQHTDDGSGVEHMDVATGSTTPTVPFGQPVGGGLLSGAVRSPTASRQPDSKPLSTSSFLLNAVLTLDKTHQQRLLLDAPLLAAYIRVIAAMSSHLSRLPASKRSAHVAHGYRRHSLMAAAVNGDDYWGVNEAASANDAGADADDDDDVDDEDDDGADDEDDDMERQMRPSALETDVLLDVVYQLNDPMHTRLIAEHVEEMFLGEPDVLHCVCQICHHLMLYNRLAQRELRLLSRLFFKPRFIRTLWMQLATQSSQLRFSSPLSLLSRGIYLPQDDIRSVIPLLATFCSMFDQLIQTLHDGEFCQEDVLPGAVSKIMPFTLAEIATISTGLKDIALGLVDLAFPETRQNINDHYRTLRHQRGAIGAAKSPEPDATEAFHKIMWPHLLKVCVSLLRQLYTRDLRRGFCAEDHWTVETLNLPLDKPDDLHLTRGRRGPRPFQPIKDFTKEDFDSGGPPLSTKQIRSITILREIPFVVPFNTRVGILQGLLNADKLRAQGDLQGFLHGPSIQLTVRRSHLYEDAFDKLRPENEPDLRPRFRVQMINNIGLEEVGIDGGGVFREFLSELIKAAFDPNRGFFMITTDNKLYPNPAVGVIVPDFQKHYYFIGRILGKALYENLLVELPLAEFFLSKLAGKKSTVDVHQLASLDPVLHHNLLGLKSYEDGGDVAELGLDFTVVTNELGGARVEELIPNGANVPVTNANHMEYIRQMAHYKLNRQIRLQCAAFRRGLSNVVTVEWLYMFSNKEFQVLISGAEIAVDVEDLERHTKYGGDFGPEHATIRHFWEVLHGFDDLQRRQLLKFVTSCSRPPLLGFKDLDPPFCIQNAGDTDRLPSASTCMNLLKLPAFPTAAQLREKLLYAIESGSGFELS